MKDVAKRLASAMEDRDQEDVAKEVRRLLRQWNAPRKYWKYSQGSLSKLLTGQREGTNFFVFLALAAVLGRDPLELATGTMPTADGVSLQEQRIIQTWRGIPAALRETALITLNQFRTTQTEEPTNPRVNIENERVVGRRTPDA